MESNTRNFIRSLAMGVLMSMLFFYSIHVFGKWSVENYRPHEETTYTVMLHNKCAILGDEHVLRPNTDVSGLGDGIDGTKLAASFMNFFDHHIAGMVVLSFLLGTVIFFIRRKIQQAGN